MALALALLISLGGCHLIFPFDSGGPPALDAPPAPRDGAPMRDARADGLHKDAPLPFDGASNDVPVKPDTLPPPADATIPTDLPCMPQPEICNGIDDDCNGSADDNLDRDCYPGASGCTLSAGGYSCQGLCKTGQQTCSKGKWSLCSGHVVPQVEFCNSMDDDCNGFADDSVVCPNYSDVCQNGSCQ